MRGRPFACRQCNSCFYICFKTVFCQDHWKIWNEIKTTEEFFKCRWVNLGFIAQSRLWTVKTPAENTSRGNCFVLPSKSRPFVPHPFLINSFKPFRGFPKVHSRKQHLLLFHVLRYYVPSDPNKLTNNTQLESSSMNKNEKAVPFIKQNKSLEIRKLF